MKVLHVYKAYYPSSRGGVENAIFQIATGTTKLGVKNDVLSLSEKHVARTVEVENHLSHRAKAHFIIKSCSFSFSMPFRFWQLAKQCDLIHYHFPWPFMDLLHLFLASKKPMVVTYHSDIVRQKILLKLYRPLMKLFIGRANRIIATSHSYVGSSEELLGFEPKLGVISLGIERDLYPKSCKAEKRFLKKKLGQKFFLFVGVLRYYKGLNYLLDAIQNTDMRILIVGSGPTEKELKRRVKDQNMTNVIFLGAVSDKTKVALYELCVGLVFPSNLRSEAFGVSLVEASMYSKPLISCEIGTGTSYVNKNGTTGFVVKPNNIDDLRGAMLRLWNDPKLAKSMGKNALIRYEKLFTGSKAAESYYDLYKDILLLG